MAMVPPDAVQAHAITRDRGPTLYPPTAHGSGLRLPIPRILLAVGLGVAPEPGLPLVRPFAESDGRRYAPPDTVFWGLYCTNKDLVHISGRFKNGNHGFDHGYNTDSC